VPVQRPLHFARIEYLEGRGKVLLELAQLEMASGPPGRQLLLEALESHTQFGNPRWIGEARRWLARISVDDERSEHVRWAREAWASIDRADLVAELDEEFGAGVTSDVA
jgi:hypothetical protein